MFVIMALHSGLSAIVSHSWSLTPANTDPYIIYFLSHHHPHHHQIVRLFPKNENKEQRQVVGT